MKKIKELQKTIDKAQKELDKAKGQIAQLRKGEDEDRYVYEGDTIVTGEQVKKNMYLVSSLIKMPMTKLLNRGANNGNRNNFDLASLSDPKSTSSLYALIDDLENIELGVHNIYIHIEKATE